jgi:hypothetical protein
MMEASATTTQGLVSYGAMKVANVHGLMSLGGISVEDGSWIPLRENPEEAMARAVKNLPEGADPRVSLILYEVRFRDHGVSHYFKENILWKHAGGYRFYANLPQLTTSQSGEVLRELDDNLQMAS